MIDIKTEADGSLVTITPDGKISAQDITAMGDALDSSINTHDRMPAILIHAKRFPGYEDFAAMIAHLKLVHNHERLLPRVALVSDGFLLRMGEPIAKVFIKAEVRHFAEEDIADAVDWAKKGTETPHALKMLEGLPNDVLAMEVSGRLTAADYESVLDPLIAKKLERHDRLKVLLVVPDSFEGATTGAAWDDMKLGLKEFTKYSKLALVTDIHWLRNSARLFGPIMPAQVHTYPMFQRDLAEDWIKT